MSLSVISHAIRLKQQIKEQGNYGSDIQIGASGTVTLRIRLSMAQHDFIADLHKILGIDFERTRTMSNRTKYSGQIGQLHITISTNLPFCSGAPFRRMKVDRIKTWFECPVPSRR